jgi:putative transposase
LRGAIKTVTVSRNPDGKYFVSVLVDDGKANPESVAVSKAVGIDVGLTHFAITSDGSKFDNPRYFVKRQTQPKAQTAKTFSQKER